MVRKEKAYNLLSSDTREIGKKKQAQNGLLKDEILACCLQINRIKQELIKQTWKQVATRILTVTQGYRRYSKQEQLASIVTTKINDGVHK